MAIRKIRTLGDEILEKKAKEVKEVTEKVSILIDDMLDTMYDAQGVGLAAPQVGILKRIVVIDVSEGEEAEPIILINPVIVETSGEQEGPEGCLSVPGKVGVVKRPDYVRVKAFDEEMNEVEYEGRGLLARAFIHEVEHLDGIVYVSHVEGELYDVNEYYASLENGEEV